MRAQHNAYPIKDPDSGGCNDGEIEMPASRLIEGLTKNADVFACYVEEPFGTGEDHLDLDGIAQDIERSVSEVRMEDT